jgi:hypothetical protein
MSMNNSTKCWMDLATQFDNATFHKRLDVVRKEYAAKSDAAIAACAPPREGSGNSRKSVSVWSALAQGADASQAERASASA